jgi:hypothetical protein
MSDYQDLAILLQDAAALADDMSRRIPDRDPRWFTLRRIHRVSKDAVNAVFEMRTQGTGA